MELTPLFVYRTSRGSHAPFLRRSSIVGALRLFSAIRTAPALRRMIDSVSTALASRSCAMTNLVPVESLKCRERKEGMRGALLHKKDWRGHVPSSDDILEPAKKGANSNGGNDLVQGTNLITQSKANDLNHTSLLRHVLREIANADQRTATLSERPPHSPTTSRIWIATTSLLCRIHPRR